MAKQSVKKPGGGSRPKTYDADHCNHRGFTMESTKAPETIDHRRRRFLGTAAMTIAGLEFSIGAPARAQESAEPPPPPPPAELTTIFAIPTTLNVNSGQDVTVPIKVDAIPMAQVGHFFIHIENAAGDQIASRVVTRTPPTTSLSGILEFSQPTPIAAGTPAGDLDIFVGLFNGSERYPFTPGAGVVATSDTRYKIGKVTVAEVVTTGPLNAAPTSDVLPIIPYDAVTPSDWFKVPASVADDTVAIQNLLNGLGNKVGINSTVLLPPRTYRITNTLRMTMKEGSNFLGNGKDTILSWAGPSGGTMFVSDSNAFSTFEGIVWEGNGIASTGFAHNSVQSRESRIVHRHEEFRNFTGIALNVMPNKPDQKYTEEVLEDNLIFRNCHTGISLIQANDYLHSITSCAFYDMTIGIVAQQGQFFARNCHFERSKDTDFLFAGSTHGQSIRRCTSLDSRMFARVGQITYKNNLPVVMEDNIVEGWKNVDGAITMQFRGPLTLFDTAFKRPPTGAIQTIKLINDASFKQALVLSNVTTEGTQPLVTPGAGGFVSTIPAGARGGSLAKANLTSGYKFTRTKAAGWGKIFDIRSYGGSTANADNGPAYRAAVAAAKAHGNKAVAYIPGGNWNFTSTVTLDGANYVASGVGHKTKLFWNGVAGGTLFLVNNPQDVTLRYMDIGLDQKNVDWWSVKQTSSGIGSKVTYDDIMVRSDFSNRQQGFLLDGLKTNDIVNCISSYGGMIIRNSGDATILLGHQGYFPLVIEGSGYGGFIGGLASFAVNGGTPVIHVKDNNSFVASDWYTEGSLNYVIASGAPGQPSGRITLGAPRLGTSRTTQDVLINNYEGRISTMGSPYDYMNDPNGFVYKTTQTGTRPVTVVAIGNAYHGLSASAAPIFEGAINKVLVGNIIDSWAPNNPTMNMTIPNVGNVTEAAAALDHMRELGEMDLILNQGFVRA